MIDIIINIRDKHSRLEKILLSVLLQTVKENINVYIIDNTDYNYDYLLNKFGKKICIKVFNMDSSFTFGRMKQFALEHSTSKYVMFFSENDFFDNCFSLQSILSIAEESNSDIVYGNVIVSEDDVSNVFSNNLFDIVGKLFRREFLINNGICFNDTSVSEDCSFYGICSMITTNINYCNYNVCYHIDDENIEYIDYLSSIVSNIKYAVEFVSNENTKMYLFSCIKKLHGLYVENLDIINNDISLLMSTVEKMYFECGV